MTYFCIKLKGRTFLINAQSTSVQLHFTQSNTFIRELKALPRRSVIVLFCRCEEKYEGGKDKDSQKAKINFIRSGWKQFSLDTLYFAVRRGLVSVL